VPADDLPAVAGWAERAGEFTMETSDGRLHLTGEDGEARDVRGLADRFPDYGAVLAGLPAATTSVAVARERRLGLLEQATVTQLLVDPAGAVSVQPEGGGAVRLPAVVRGQRLAISSVQHAAPGRPRLDRIRRAAGDDPAGRARGRPVRRRRHFHHPGHAHAAAHHDGGRPMTQLDPTITEITAAVELGRGGHRAGARERLVAVWERLGPDGDPLQRVSCAHFLADPQDDVGEELTGDERALAAVGDLTDERVQQHTAAMQVRGLMPSLHLNLADCHRRLGDPTRAREYLAEAERSVDALADDEYGRMLRGGLQHVGDALDAGLTEALPTAP
jgi:hypothetical protein